MPETTIEDVLKKIAVISEAVKVLIAEKEHLKDLNTQLLEACKKLIYTSHCRETVQMAQAAIEAAEAK